MKIDEDDMITQAEAARIRGVSHEAIRYRQRSLPDRQRPLLDGQHPLLDGERPLFHGLAARLTPFVCFTYRTLLSYVPRETFP